MEVNEARSDAEGVRVSYEHVGERARTERNYPRTSGETLCGTIHPTMDGARCGDRQPSQVAMFDGKPAQAMHAATTSAT